MYLPVNVIIKFVSSKIFNLETFEYSIRSVTEIKWLMKSKQITPIYWRNSIIRLSGLTAPFILCYFYTFFKETDNRDFVFGPECCVTFDVTNNNITWQTIPIIGQIRFNNFWSVSKQVLSIEKIRDFWSWNFSFFFIITKSLICCKWS